MGFLSEDPTYLAGGLGILAVLFLILLRVTQQGRYLIRALVALGLLAAVLVIEHFWVTDAERIEQVVHELRNAVLASDAERALGYMTPDVEFVRRGHTGASGEATRVYIRSVLGNTKFDFLRLGHLQTEAFPRSRRGSAEFQVVAGGSMHQSFQSYNFATTTSAWSLGFEETSPGVWKVNRISPTQVPRDLPLPGRSGPDS
jgi:hypothetical protein